MSEQKFIKIYGEEAWEKEQERRRELGRQAQKKYRDRHKEKLKEKNREQCRNYYNSKSGRAINIIHKYTQSDFEENRGACTLKKDWVIEHIFNSSCIYCGDSNWKHLGCDRIYDNLPHTQDNCVCACGICNVERYFKRMSVEEFVEYRKTHPRDVDFKLPQQIVEINGKKVIKKAG